MREKVNENGVRPSRRTTRAEIGDTEPHPQAPQVDAERKVVLFDAQDRPLVRRIGFRTQNP